MCNVCVEPYRLWFLVVSWTGWRFPDHRCLELVSGWTPEDINSVQLLQLKSSELHQWLQMTVVWQMWKTKQNEKSYNCTTLVGRVQLKTQRTLIVTGASRWLFIQGCTTASFLSSLNSHKNAVMSEKCEQSMNSDCWSPCSGHVVVTCIKSNHHRYIFWHSSKIGS